MTGPDSEGLQAGNYSISGARRGDVVQLCDGHRAVCVDPSDGGWWFGVSTDSNCRWFTSGQLHIGRPVLIERADLPSLVVPSVGAVPVEVPEDSIEAAVAEAAEHEAGLALEVACRGRSHDRRVAAFRAYRSLIAARVRAETEAAALERVGRVLGVAIAGNSGRRMATQRLVERITADVYAALQADDGGLTDHDARVRAEERQRIAALIRENAGVSDSFARSGSPAGLTAYLINDVMGRAGAAVPVATPQRPEIVVLCGSTRFKDAFREAAKAEALAGRIVLTVSDLDPRPEMRHVNVPIDAEMKARLDQLHRHKIDLADRALVLNVGGYIGESTRSEIEYATAKGKPVTYLEDGTPSEPPDDWYRRYGTDEDTGAVFAYCEAHGPHNAHCIGRARHSNPEHVWAWPTVEDRTAAEQEGQR